MEPEEWFPGLLSPYCTLVVLARFYVLPQSGRQSNRIHSSIYQNFHVDYISAGIHTIQHVNIISKLFTQMRSGNDVPCSSRHSRKGGQTSPVNLSTKLDAKVDMGVTSIFAYMVVTDEGLKIEGQQTAHADTFRFFCPLLFALPS